MNHDTHRTTAAAAPATMLSLLLLAPACPEESSATDFDSAPTAGTSSSSTTDAPTTSGTLTTSETDAATTEAGTTRSGADSLDSTDSSTSSLGSTTGDDCSPNPPTIEKIETKEVPINTLLTVQVKAADVDGGTLNYLSPDLPPDATLDEKTGKFSWTPKVGGAHWLTVIVSDGCNEADIKFKVLVLDGTEDLDGDGAPASEDCDDKDPKTGPLKPGENTIKKSMKICDGVYKASITLTGYSITVEPEQYGVVLDGGYVYADGLHNSTVSNIHVINGQGKSTPGFGWKSALYLSESNGNKFEYMSITCPDCDFTGFLSSAINNTLDHCSLIDGKYNLVLSLSSNNNTIQNSRFIDPEAEWVVDQGMNNKLVSNMYL